MSQDLGRGYSFEGAPVPREPAVKRAITFVDGQNLFHAVRESFGYTYPNYDVLALSSAICGAAG